MALTSSRVRLGQHDGWLDYSTIKDLAHRNPDEFLGKARQAIDEGKMSLDKIESLPALYGALRDVPVTVHQQDRFGTRAITTSAFPVLTGDLMVKAIDHAYNAVPTIGGMLVTEMRDPNKNTWVALIDPLTIDQDTVKEGDDFPAMSATEEAMLIGSRRNGRLITITQELIEENRVGDLVRRVNALGEWAAEEVEYRTLYQVTDTGSVVYKPNGTAEALYSGTARARTGSGGNLNTGATLVDFTDLEAARVDLAAMKSPLGYRISMRYPLDLLVPDALAYKAMRLVQSPFVAEQTTQLYVQSINEWSKGGMFSTRVITSPKLDDLSATTWYLGNFDKQFTRKWKFDMEMVTLGSNTTEYLRSRTAAQMRVAFDCEVGATDYVFVVANTA